MAALVGYPIVYVAQNVREVDLVVFLVLIELRALEGNRGLLGEVGDYLLVLDPEGPGSVADKFEGSDYAGVLAGVVPEGQAHHGPRLEAREPVHPGVEPRVLARVINPCRVSACRDPSGYAGRGRN